jgi:hypothetical protein
VTGRQFIGALRLGWRNNCTPSFQHVAPRSREQRRWLPPLGGAPGFAIGTVGKQLLG